MPRPNDLLPRVQKFSLAVLEFYRRLPATQEAQVPGVQVYRAATSMALNYRAAKRGRSTAEFIAKLGTVVEEADEVVGWLKYMRDGRIAFDEPLLREAGELLRIFGKSLGTARRNARNRR